MQDVTELYGSVEFARMRTIEDAIEKARGVAAGALEEAVTSFGVVFGDEKTIGEPPWYTAQDADGELIPMLPSIDLWAAFHKHQDTGNELHVLNNRVRAQFAQFRREDITAWLQAKGYKQAKYFLSSKEQAPDGEALHQAEIDKMQAQIDWLREELEKKKSEQTYVDDAHPGEREKLLRHIGALALLLAEKSGTFRVGNKPNALQIAEAVGALMDETQDMNRRGLGSSYIRASISEGLRLLQK